MQNQFQRGQQVTIKAGSKDSYGNETFDEATGATYERESRSRPGSHYVLLNDTGERARLNTAAIAGGNVRTKADIEAEKAAAETKVTEFQKELDFLAETGAEEISDDLVLAYQAISIFEKGDFTKGEKAKALADLFGKRA